MTYLDPLPITCPACGSSGEYSVRDLVALQARCLHCHQSLDVIGQKMRAQGSEWAIFFGKVWTTAGLEKELGIEVSDTELDNAQTGLELIHLIEQKVYDAKQRMDLVERVRSAIESTRGIETSQQDLNLRFQELFEARSYAE